MAAPRFPDRLRLPLDFEPAPLAADLARLSASGWTAHFVTQNYDGDWSAIALRAPAGARHPVQALSGPKSHAGRAQLQPEWTRRSNSAKAARLESVPPLQNFRP